MPLRNQYDPTRMEDPNEILRLLGLESDFDAPAKVRSRVAALRGDPSAFENDQQYGLAGTMLRGPTAERMSKTLYTQGTRGKERFAEGLEDETTRAQGTRAGALSQTMANIKDRRAAETAAAEREREDYWKQKDYALRAAAERRQAAQQGQDAFAAIADPITGEIVLYNKRTGERVQGGQQRQDGQLPQFNPALGMKPTEKMKNDLTAIQQQRGSVQGALTAAQGNPKAFGFAEGALERFGGDVGTAFAQWKRNPEDTATRAYVLNNVSAIINERAGAAQSVQELARLRGFLPSDTDDVAHVEAKFNAFLDYLDEREAATRGYKPDELGFTPRTGVGPRRPEFQQPGQGPQPGSSRDNPISLD